MAKLQRYTAYAHSLNETLYVSTLVDDDGAFMESAEVLSAIAKLEAENERLRNSTYTPINSEKIQCTEFAGGGANQHGDYLIVWSGYDEAAIHLPDGVRLMRKVE